MREMSLSSTVGLVATLGFTTVGLVSCESVDYVEAFETETAIQRVVITADVGDLRVVGGQRQNAAVERSVNGWKGGIELSSLAEEGTLYLTARCTSWLGCRVDTELEVPAGAVVEVDLGQGDVALVDLEGPIALAVSAGQVTGEGLRADEVSVTLSSGDLSLYFDRAPALVEAALAAGDVAVDLPAATVDVDADLAGGELNLQGLVSSEDAPSRVDVISAGGDLSISAMRADRAAAR